MKVWHIIYEMIVITTEHDGDGYITFLAETIRKK